MTTRGRKTVPVDQVRNAINARLQDRGLGKEAKGELVQLLETLLMETDNYKGFRWTGVTYEEARDMQPDHEQYFNRMYF